MEEKVVRYKAELGVEDYATRRHGWWISEAVETDIVVDGKKMLRSGTLLFDDSAEWRYTRRHAAQDLLKKLEDVIDKIEEQIDEVRKKECAA